LIKRLQEKSKYEKFDLDHDGTITDEEMSRAKEMLEIELREEKFDQQQKMAWIAMATMFLFTVVLFSPIISEARVDALADLLGLFYIAQAGVVGTYMGAQALMHKK
jgi:hypothetical protein